MMRLAEIYCITKPDEVGLFEKVEFLLNSGVHIIQLRDKYLSIDQYQEQIQKYKHLFMKYKAQLIVNDHISVAIEEGVGLHIGWEDLQKYAQGEGILYTEALWEIRSKMHHNTLLGLTVHNNIDLIQKVSHIVDYVGVGPIFSTTTKLDAKSILGTSSLREICSKTDVPIVAVGGIKESNLHELLNTGAEHFAICSDIFDAVDISQKIHNIAKILKNESSDRTY
jgi:thiamine-phosphate pyrophosphorylase